jgi:hypothetical protein
MKNRKPETQTEALRRELAELVENLLPAARQVMDDCVAKRARALVEGEEEHDVDEVENDLYNAQHALERLQFRKSAIVETIKEAEEAKRVAELRARMKLRTREDGRPYLHDVWFASPKLQEQFTYFELMNAPSDVKRRVIDEAMARLPELLGRRTK